MVAKYVNAVVALELRDLLAAEPMTYETLQARSGVSKVSLARWVKINRARIRIASWAPDKNGRPFLAMFQWGDAPDVPRPGRALTGAEQMRKLRERRKAEQQGVGQC